jgi:hypothetical protein
LYAPYNCWDCLTATPVQVKAKGARKITFDEFLTALLKLAERKVGGYCCSALRQHVCAMPDAHLFAFRPANLVHFSLHEPWAHVCKGCSVQNAPRLSSSHVLWVSGII